MLLQWRPWEALNKVGTGEHGEIQPERELQRVSRCESRGELDNSAGDCTVTSVKQKEVSSQILI